MIWEGVEVSRRVSAEAFFTQWMGVLGRACEGWTRYIRGTTTRKPLGRLISISCAGSQEVNYGCDRQVRDEA